MTRLERIKARRVRAFNVHRGEHSNRSFAWLSIWDKAYHREEWQVGSASKAQAAYQ